MRIREWMTNHVVYVNSTTSILKAKKLMEAHDIRRLPVVDNDMHVVGIVSDRDIKDASPSKATTLDMHELQYLLSNLKIQDIMTSKPVTVTADDTVEHVALILEEKGLSALPVVNEKEELVGIISNYDLYNVFIEVSGAKQSGLQLEFEMPDAPGSLCGLFNFFCEHAVNILSVLTDRKKASSGKVFVYVRISTLAEDKEEALIAACAEKFSLRHWQRAKGF